MNEEDLAKALSQLLPTFNQAPLSADGNGGRAMAWFFLNATTIARIETTIEIIQGALIAICNLYFIACFIFVDDFLSMDTYPFFLQSIIDFTCNGIFTIVDGITHGLLAYGILSQDYTDIRATAWYCWVVFANSRASSCSTPFTMTLVAITRYINVCLPLKAKEKWFRKLMVCGNILVTAIPLCMLTAHGCVLYFMKSLYIAEICALGFYPSKRVKGVVDGVVLYIVPGLVCCMLYALIGKTLWGMTAMKTRNRQLTVLFGVTCVVWIVFWLPENCFYLTVESDDAHMAMQLWTSGKVYWVMNSSYSTFITRTFSAIQPLIIVCCYRPLFTPLLRLRCCCKENQGAK